MAGAWGQPVTALSRHAPDRLKLTPSHLREVQERFGRNPKTHVAAVRLHPSKTQCPRVRFLHFQPGVRSCNERRTRQLSTPPYFRRCASMTQDILSFEARLPESSRTTNGRRPPAPVRG